MTLPSRVVVIYDDRCGFCSGLVQWIVPRLRVESFLWLPASGTEADTLCRAHGYDAARLQSIVLIDGTRVLTESRAVLRILAAMRIPWSWFVIARVIPQPVRDAAYRFIARHRGSLRCFRRD